MVHPDYQYMPKFIPAMAAMIGNGLYHCAIGSRILGGYALRGGMPLWRYLANRFLRLSENLLVGAKLSEYHSCYRAFSRQLLDHLNLEQNSDDFVFDNQMLIQIIWHGYAIAEVTCPTDYNEEGSSINFRRSVKYGFGCLRTALTFRLGKLGLYRSRILSANRERCPRDRRPDDRSLTSVSVQGEGLLQNRGGEGAPTVVGDIPPGTRPDIRPE
jgi:hypothetical protein